MQQQTAALIQLAQKLQNCDPLDYDNIDIPFQLMQTALELWGNLYPPEVLENLANSDPDTLDAWAIALSKTLGQQLSLLNTWQPHLSASSIPPKLAEKLKNNHRKFAEISRETSELLATADELLSQERQLIQAGEELAQLKHRVAKLNRIETELKTADLEQLRRDIETRSHALEPQYQQLEQLQQKQSELQAQTDALNRQQTRLASEIEILRSRQNKREANTAEIATELITLTQAERNKLNSILSDTLAELQQEKAEFDRIQTELETAIAHCNRYQQQTAAIRDDLSRHYESDRDLGQYLPINHQQIDPILEQIKTQLRDLDRQLADLQNRHAEQHKKLALNFSS
ncbi:hypothetical protein [Lyngbya sp. CCY1209]|uniref:hypothetical protein n=1 Tax=Lyngbya sp. CCY1209 TaxID=2886103 RepID=UPI002D2117F6|nr:hypothetical protein [Lyngbya sp. CCY1209]MEB3886069.1 hypothetical protein [Lyngbya sp. CCY1209]